MGELICESCGEVMALAQDTEGDLTVIKITCVCGRVNSYDFIGYPQLYGTDKYYFNFIDEDKLECHLR